MDWNDGFCLQPPTIESLHGLLKRIVFRGTADFAFAASSARHTASWGRIGRPGRILESDPRPDEDTQNDADGKHPEHELCSPAPVHAVASHGRSMAERQILGDAVYIGCCENRGLSQRPAAFGAFALKQMATACPVKEHFSVSGYFETFRYGFPCFDSFGTSHAISLSW